MCVLETESNAKFSSVVVVVDVDVHGWIGIKARMCVRFGNGV